MSSSTQTKTVIRGTVIHARSARTCIYADGSSPLEVLRDAVLVIENGRILRLLLDDEKEKVWDDAMENPAVKRVHVPPPQLVLPGFIDTHFHAPQFAFTGTATDKPLMGDHGWLESYTFPAERKCSDPEYARALYNSCLNHLIKNGTTCAVFFGTIDRKSNAILAELCLQKGLRAVVGHVAMDRNSPDDYIQTEEEALGGTEELINFVYSQQQQQQQQQPPFPPLVDVAITPRFLPTCTPSLLGNLGELWKKYRKLHPTLTHTTHISESIDQLAFCAHLHPEQPRDLQHFKDAQLLGPRSVLAHAVLLNEQELLECARTGTAIASCPLSNFYFAGCQLQTAKILSDEKLAELRIGLGTDVAGGYHYSMLSAIRASVLAQKSLDHVDNASAEKGGLHAAKEAVVRPWDWRHAFWLATVGGARALHAENCCIGRFSEGAEFDAQIVNPPQLLGNICPPGLELPSSGDKEMEALERYINFGDDRNVVGCFVRGREITIK